MQQFGPQFINEHLMPLLEEMLTDTVQRKKDYLDALFITGTLRDYEKTSLMDYYFDESRKNNGVPFVGPEESKEREEFLRHFVEYIRSRGANPQERIRAFLPVLNQKSEGEVKQVIWPAEVKRNLFLMSYDIAEKFEKAKIDECLTKEEKVKRAEEAQEIQRDRKLFEKGLLILVKNPKTGQFDQYIRATEIKPGDTVVQALPPPPPEIAAFIQSGFRLPPQENLAAFANGATSPLTVGAPSVYRQSPASEIVDVVSPYDEIVKSFHQKRGKSIKDQLAKQGFEVLGEVTFDSNEQATVKVKSGNDILLVAVDTKVPLAKDPRTPQDLKFRFTFQDGTGRTFAIDESKLDDAFNKLDNTKRTAMEYYNDVALRNRIEKGEAVPEQAPENFGKLQPKVEPPKIPGVPQLPPVLPGTVLRPVPLEGSAAAISEAQKFALPQNMKVREPLPHRAEGAPENAGVQEEAARSARVNYHPTAVKKAEFFAKTQKEGTPEAEMEQPTQLPLENPPLAANRYREAAVAQPPPKNNFVRNMVIANVVPLGASLGAGLGLGSSLNNPQTLTAVKTFMIAVTKFLPHLFG